MNEKQYDGEKRTDGNKKPSILPLINNYSSRQKWEEDCWQTILESKRLLELLITSHERRDLIMRAAAIDGIFSGKSYRQLSKDIFLSVQTISNVKKALTENNYKSYLERSKKERKKRTYSSSSTSIIKSKHRGRPIRTKYGTLYMPY